MGASDGSLEGGRCTSSSYSTSPVPARPSFADQASPASTAGAAATNLRRETPPVAPLAASVAFIVGPFCRQELK